MRDPDVAAPPGDVGVPVPLAARVVLAHASAQFLADSAGADLLHIKGPASDPRIRPTRDSSDADVLVRPAHVDRLLAALEATGWSLASDFDEGSAWRHAATWLHPDLGYLDVHRWWPGFSVPAEDAFARLWAGSLPTDLGHRALRVPSLPGQLLIAVLHVARNEGPVTRGSFPRVPARWWSGAAVVAEQLGAQEVFAWALGEGELARDRSEAALWGDAGRGAVVEHPRLSQWAARWRAAEDWPARLVVIRLLISVPRRVQAMELGHEPRFSERVTRQFQRLARLVRELRELARGR